MATVEGVGVARPFHNQKLGHDPQTIIKAGQFQIEILGQLSVEINNMSITLSITPPQCRAAWAFIDLTQSQLAELVNISVTTLSDFELGDNTISDQILESIKDTLENEGIKFINAYEASSDCHGPGIRLRCALN